MKTDWRLLLITFFISIAMLVGMLEFRMNMVRILFPLFAFGALGYMLYVVCVALGIEFYKKEDKKESKNDERR